METAGAGPDLCLTLTLKKWFPFWEGQDDKAAGVWSLNIDRVSACLLSELNRHHVNCSVFLSESMECTSGALRHTDVEVSTLIYRETFVCRG